jgi:opacity protein-like surface antigen
MQGMVKLLAAAALVAVTAGSIEAQSFGIHVGPAVPVGDFGKGSSTGFQAGVELGFTPATLPIGIRIDGDFNHFGFEGGGGNNRIISGTANAVFSLPAAAISPYLIGGLGMFNGKTTISAGGVNASGSSTEFGFQVGGGLRFALAGLATAIEAKYVTVNADGGNLSYIPITFRVALR